MKRRVGTFLLMIALLRTLPPAPVLAADGIVDASEISYFEMPVIDPRFPSVSVTGNSEDDPNAVPLANKRAAAFIDRFRLPQFAMDFYDALVRESKPSGTSGLGRDGYLIDPSQAPSTFPFSDGANYVAPFPYPAEAELKSAGFQFADLKEFVENCADAAYYSFKRDHPEAVWLRGYASYIDTNKRILYLNLAKVGFPEGTWEIRAEGYRDPDTIKNTLNALNSSIASIVNEASKMSSNYEKVQYFNEWLTTNNQYNYNIAYDKGEVNGDIYEAHCALITKDHQPGSGRFGTDGPVCASYATALQLLCREANIPCVTVETPEHMWNYVQIDPPDSRWYGMDVTWNDPVMSETPTLEEYLQWGGSESTAYTLVGADTIVYDGKSETFLDQHPAENLLKVGGVVLANFSMGPELNQLAYVDSVVIQDLDPPEAGAVPDTSVTLTSNPKSNHHPSTAGTREVFTNPVVTWSPVPVNGRFAADTTYTATITYTPLRQGYGLTPADASKITVPGAANVTVDANGAIQAVFSTREASGLHGKVSVSVDGASPGHDGTAYVVRDAVITIHVTPDPGYRLSTLQVIREDHGQPVSLSGAGTVYTFKMPPSDVSIQAVFSIS